MPAGLVGHFISAVTDSRDLLIIREIGKRAGCGKDGGGDSLDGLVEHNDCEIMRVAFVMSIQRISMPRPDVGLVTSLVSRVERDCHSGRADVAMGGG